MSFMENDKSFGALVFVTLVLGLLLSILSILGLIFTIYWSYLWIAKATTPLWWQFVIMVLVILSKFTGSSNEN